MVVDRKGIAVFPADTDLRYCEETHTFFDTACRERGSETLCDIVEALDMLKCDPQTKNWVHHKFVVDINVVEEAHEESKENVSS